MKKLYEVETNGKGAPNFSTAKEVPERRRGKWIRVSADKYRISTGYAYMCDKCGDTTWYNGNFCSNCGADMREEDNEQT